MIQLDLCVTCPKCGNGSLTKREKYKYIGLKYSHTEYKCLMDNCGWFTNSHYKNLIWDNPMQFNRDEKLKELGI